MSLLAAPAAVDTMTLATLCRKANHAGETPLHVAARWGFADMVTLLASYHPAALTLADARGRTPADVRRRGRSGLRRARSRGALTVGCGT